MLGEDKLREALTFDDVLLVPSESDVHRATPTSARASPTPSSLYQPLISSAMDTVTEAATAICMAREGGIGRHPQEPSPSRSRPRDRQGQEGESGIVVDPVTIGPSRSWPPPRAHAPLQHQRPAGGRRRLAGRSAS
jgi:IMP dehydrogenase